MYLQFVQPHSKTKKILIYGAGTSGIVTYNALKSEGHLSNVLCAFVDDNPKLHNSRINGIKVIGPKQVTKEFLAEKMLKR